MRRLSRPFSSAETIRLDCQPHEKALPRDDPESYIIRTLDELVDERPASEVLLKELRAYDSLTIRTENSTYTFLVLDPVGRAGILTGGKLKRHMISVILIGALDGLGIGPVRDEPARLRTGAQASFDLKSGKSVRRFTTSRIKHILHGRGLR